ncbi:MAG TPA: hypothetical protein VGO11_20650 [Chthoniobacteraceae bacterium]|nr:hypothetical protein [Chthoniobacteraceae bacterium]
MKISVRPWLRLALFSVPLLVFFGVPVAALWLGGEWMPSIDIRTRLGATPGRLVLHGPAFSNRIIYQKTRLIDERRPQVLTLGTSRVLQFRAGFFLPDVRFLNGGSCIQRVVHFRSLLANIPKERQPEVLILGLDQYWFNPKSAYTDIVTRGTAWFEEQRTHEFDRVEMLRHNWWTIDRDLWTGAVPLQKLLSGAGRTDRLGFTALVRDEGTRNDGSYRYRSYFYDLDDARHLDRNFSESFRKIDHGLLPYEWSSELHAPALKEMEELLAECDRRGVMVVGFLPPFAHPLIEEMAKIKGGYDYLPKLEPALRPLFEQHGFELYDYTDAAQLGTPDREAIDGFHGTERTYIRLLVAMLRQGSALNAYASLPELEQVLATTTAPSELVPERF